MKRAFTPVLMVAAALAVSGCGRNLPKLTEEQKSQFGEVLSSTGQVQRAVPKQQNMGRPLLARPASVTALTILGLDQGLQEPVTQQPALDFNRALPPPSSPNLGRPENAMRSRLESAHCDISTNFGSGGGFGGGSSSFEIPRENPSSGGMPSFGMELNRFTFDIHVSGASCPMSMDLALKLQGEARSAKADFVWNYSVKDEDFRKLNDVVGVDLKGNLKINGDSSGQGGNGDLNIKGKIVSQKHGELPVELTGNIQAQGGSSGQPAVNGEVSLFVQFKDFGVEMKNKMSGEKVQYFINGEELSEQEFKTYVTKLFE